MQLSPQEQRETCFYQKREDRGGWYMKINVLRLWTKWRKRKREEKKRELIAHQEAYAIACKAEEHRKAEAVQRAKRNIEHEIRNRRI